MADVQHSGLTGSNVHEPKGADTASADDVYILNGAGSGVMMGTADVTRTGIYDYNDLATASSPITLTPTGTFITATNDGAGPNTNLAYGLPDVSAPWNTGTDRFDWTALNIGDWVDIRFDVEITTTAANTVINSAMELGVGGSPYTLNMGSSYFKSTGTYEAIRYIGFYMGDANTKDNPARVLVKSDAGTATLKVNGWYIKVGKRGLIV